MTGPMLCDPPAHDLPLEHALARLVHEGVLGPDQARRVEEARDLDAGLAAAAAERPLLRQRLPEVLGYLGGAFVLSAGVVVVVQMWQEIGLVLRVGLAVTAALALVVTGLFVAASGSGGWAALRTAADAPRRRLAGVLLVLAAPLAGLALGLVLDDAGVRPVLLLSAALAAAVGALAVVVAGGVVPTAGLFAGVALILVGAGELFDSAPTLAWVVVVLATGSAWTALAPRLTGAPVLALCLGLLAVSTVGLNAAQYAQPDLPDLPDPAEWGATAVVPVGYAVLVGLVALGVVLYLRGAAWPWVAAAGLASAEFIAVAAGEALGPVAVFLAVGLVLLLTSAVLLVRRGRRTTGC